MEAAEIAVKVATGDSEIESLRPFWTSLNTHPESDIDFVRMLASVRPEMVGFYVLVACKASRPIAMMIGRLEEAFVYLRFGYLKLAKVKVKQIVFVRDGFLGEQSDRIITLMVDQVRQDLKARRADRVLWCNVGVAGPFERHIRNHICVLQREWAQPQGQHWRTNLPEDFDAFLARRPKKHRYWLRRIGKVFEAQCGGKVRYEIFERPDQVKAFCSAAEQVAVKTYQRGLGAGFLDNQENRERLMLAAGKGGLKAYVAWVDKTPVGFWCGEHIGGVMHLTWTGFDPHYRKYEVGTVLFLKMIQDLLSCGIREIDYGLGGAQYKERFGDVCMQEQDLAIYAPRPKGYALSMLRTIEHVMNHAGKQALAWAKVTNNVKKRWRSRLAAKSTSGEECYECPP